MCRNAYRYLPMYIYIYIVIVPANIVREKCDFNDRKVIRSTSVAKNNIIITMRFRVCDEVKTNIPNRRYTSEIVRRPPIGNPVNNRCAHPVTLLCNASNVYNIYLPYSWVSHIAMCAII